MALVPEKIEIVLTEESMKVMKAFGDSVEKFCHAAEELTSALQKSSSRPTRLAPDRAKRAAKSKPSASKRSKSGAAGKA